MDHRSPNARRKSWTLANFSFSVRRSTLTTIFDFWPISLMTFKAQSALGRLPGETQGQF
ncbi:hypothetical protein AB1L30_06560 [Bremerella sp. JC817]|uniref:hypothetical protein n=1 Tax=Bremerella sp. JC817 TaxID=3231756 RepID=UPI00345A3969